MSDDNNNENNNEVEKRQKEEQIKEEQVKEEELKEEEKKEEDEELKEPLGDKISILHYLENPILVDDIESPRSINAMIQLGFIMDDIRYFTFQEYLNNNPTFHSLSRDIQKRRYEFSEQYRYAKIQKIKEFRDEIIEAEKIIKNNPENNEEINVKINENNNNNNINEEIGSTAINEELRQFERMKRKNEIDLMNAVEYELQRQIMLKEGEAKIRKQNIKNDNFKKTMEIKNEIEKKEKEER